MNFFLTTLVMITALYMLSMVLQISTNSTYYIYKTKNAFSDNEMINVSIVMTGQEDSIYYENVGRFIEELENTYGSDSGKFMYLPTNYNMQGEVRRENTLYIDSDALDLCKLKLTEDESYASSADKADMLHGYVCKSRFDEYPLGTVLKNENIGNETMIIGYFDVGSEWIPDLLLHSNEATVCLDNYIVSEMNEQYFEANNMFYANISNNIYVKVNGDIDKLRENIKSISKSCEIDCYVRTIDEIIRKEKYEKRDLLKAIGTMVAFATLVAMIGIFSSFLADVFSWHKEIAIMSVNGVAPTDIFMILFLENLIKALISFNVAAFLYGNNLGKSDKSVYFHMIAPVLLIGMVVFITITSFVAFKTIKQSRLIKIIGGEHL